MSLVSHDRSGGRSTLHGVVFAILCRGYSSRRGSTRETRLKQADKFRPTSQVQVKAGDWRACRAEDILASFVVMSRSVFLQLAEQRIKRLLHYARIANFQDHFHRIDRSPVSHRAASCAGQ